MSARLLLGLGLLIVSPWSAFAVTSSQLATCDFESLVEDFNGELELELSTLEREWAQRLQRIQTEIHQLRDDLMADTPSPTQPEVLTLLHELLETHEELDALRETARSVIEETRRAGYEQLYARIRAAADHVRRQNSYVAILDSGAVMGYSQLPDVTPAVRQRLERTED